MTLFLKDMLVATITPFTETLEIDEDALRNFVRDLTAVEGLGGIVCNANAGEGAALTREENIRVIRIIKEEIGDRVPLVAGVIALSTQEAIRIGLDAKENGSDALLIFAPIIHGWNAAKNPEFAIEYHKAIDRACEMPIIPFQYSAALANAYTHDTLIQLCREIDNIVAVKHGQFGSGFSRYIEDVRAVKRVGRPISTLVAHGALLFYAALAGGLDGTLSGFANVTPVETANLLKACKEGDMDTARRIHDRIYPVARLVYAEPYVNLHVRYKEASAMAGYIPGALVRPPQLPLEKAERAKLEQAMEQTGLLRDYRY